MATFPAIKPNYFTDITLPTYRGFDNEFDAGTVQTVQTQFTPYDVSFTLQYSQLTIAQADQLMTFYRTVYGTIGRFQMPDVVFRHDVLLTAQIRQLNSNADAWRFAEAVVITPVVADRGNECSQYQTSIKIKGVDG